MKTQRDSFWDKIYEKALNDKEIVIVCADMGAPALDKFRVKLPGQFVNVGIAEQNAVAVASGLALNAKKPYAYAIAPFITYRCYEQIKVMLSGMKIPVTLVGVGAGFSYEESGPTHHTVEDISVMRILPHMSIYSPSCIEQIDQIVEWSIKSDKPNYIRIDRQVLPSIYGEEQDFSKGFAIAKDLGDINIVATGSAVHNAVEASEKLAKKGIRAGVIDIICIPCASAELIDILSNSKKLVTVEEHVLKGGFGSYILETINELGFSTPVKRLGIDFKDSYCYTFGGRDKIQQMYKIDADSIVATVESML